MIPKPERRSKVKRRKAHQRGLSRAQCRQLVFRREQSCCQRCGRRVTDDCEPWRPERAHVNEMVPRSQGGSTTDLSNLELCCHACHLPHGQHAPTVERMQQIHARYGKRMQCPYCKEWCAHGFCGRCERFLSEVTL